MSQSNKRGPSRSPPDHKKKKKADPKAGSTEASPAITVTVKENLKPKTVIIFFTLVRGEAFFNGSFHIIF